MNKLKLTIFTVIALLAFGKTANAKKEQPNILWIITDEHNFRTLGCYRDQLDPEQALMWGDPVVETPNIDKLADKGAIFTRMYSSSPVCSPCRSSMFTGQYPQTVGVPKNDLVMKTEFPTIATVLSKEGYSTGYAGKWHLSGEAKPGWEPNPKYGFQDNRYMFNRGHWKKLGFEESGNPYVAARDKKGEPSYNVANADDKSFTTDWLADRTIEFIDKNKNNPFFYVLSLPDPHGPNSVRAPYNTMFADAEFKIPESYYYKKSKADPKWRGNDPKLKEEDAVREMLVQYYGMVKCIDDNIGKVISKLEKEGILDNTIVLFSSDHGDLMGEHKRLNKGVPFEGSAKIPFVVYYPKSIKAGTVVTKAANATDWMETFLSMAGIKNRPETAGRDLSKLIRKPELKNWDDITFSRMGGWVAALDSRYKFIIDGSKSEPWLMDIEKDPDEAKNFYNDPLYKDVVVRLAKKLNAYMIDQNDPLMKNSKEVMGKLNKALAK